MGEIESFKTVPIKDLRFVRTLDIFRTLENKRVTMYRLSCLDLDSTNEDLLAGKEKLLNNYLSSSLKEPKVIIEPLQTIDYCRGSLKITVNDGEREIYSAVAMSLDQSTSFLLFCLKGDNKANDVHKALDTVLSCSVSNIGVNHSNLEWILALCLHDLMKLKDLDDLVLSYQLPGADWGSIDFEFTPEDIKKVWGCFHDPLDPVIRKREAQNFMAEIENHLFSISGVDLNKCRLVKIQEKGIMLDIRKRFSLRVKAPELLYVLSTFILSYCK